jgi:nucleotide-binding universal stress UspA family protein
LLLIGDTVSEIANHAKEMQSDLIVVGHCLQKNWKRRWWSLETSKSLVEAVRCSVLVVGL